MSASLVGSEMCIRDSPHGGARMCTSGLRRGPLGPPGSQSEVRQSTRAICARRPLTWLLDCRGHP
eukprot:10484914-Alexandrium_andersonii.AAC.1